MWHGQGAHPKRRVRNVATASVESACLLAGLALGVVVVLMAVLVVVLVVGAPSWPLLLVVVLAEGSGSVAPRARTPPRAASGRQAVAGARVPARAPGTLFSCIVSCIFNTRCVCAGSISSLARSPSSARSLSSSTM